MIDAAGLRVMRAIAEEGSFTGAAVALGYSQPAVSQMVRRLEQRTGTVLVERVGRNVRLTEAGQVLARHAVGVLTALDAAEEEVAAIAGLRAGRVRLMAFPSSSASLVPQALALVKERFPDVTVTFSEGEPPESLAALRAGECDIAVAFAYEGTDIGRGEDLDDFVTLKLLDDEVRLAVPLNHPLAGRDEVELVDFQDESWIAGCPRCRGHLLALTRRAGFAPTVSLVPAWASPWCQTSSWPRLTRATSPPSPSRRPRAGRSTRSRPTISNESPRSRPLSRRWRKALAAIRSSPPDPAAH
jgi:DNA-binding transcriptional LysR family regulator